MRARRLLSTAAASAGALVVTGGLILAGAAPAHADAVFVEVNPTTIQAGYPVSIRASCGVGVNTATVKSDAFGQITLVKENDLLTATVTIPGDLKARGYNVRLSCPSTNTATTTLWVVGMPAPTKGPHTGGGGLAAGTNGTNGTGGGSASGAGSSAVGGATLLGGGLTALGLGAGLGWIVRRRSVLRRRTARSGAAA